MRKGLGGRRAVLADRGVDSRGARAKHKAGGRNMARHRHRQVCWSPAPPSCLPPEEPGILPPASPPQCWGASGSWTTRPRPARPRRRQRSRPAGRGRGRQDVVARLPSAQAGRSSAPHPCHACGGVAALHGGCNPAPARAGGGQQRRGGPLGRRGLACEVWVQSMTLTATTRSRHCPRYTRPKEPDPTRGPISSPASTSGSGAEAKVCSAARRSGSAPPGVPGAPGADEAWLAAEPTTGVAGADPSTSTNQKQAASWGEGALDEGRGGPSKAPPPASRPPGSAPAGAAAAGPAGACERGEPLGTPPSAVHNRSVPAGHSKEHYGHAGLHRAASPA